MSEHCEATTSKKAWRNPLAPKAYCSNEYTKVVEINGKQRKLCTRHANLAAKGEHVRFRYSW